MNYTPVAKGLHWLMALLIVGMLVLGIYMSDLQLSPQKLELYSWHKWVGVTVFMLVWLRLAWRLTHRPPPLPSTLSPRMRWAAHAGHALLYVLMVAIPLTGWLMSSAKGFQTVWFGVLPIPDVVERSRELGDLLQGVHKVLNVVLILTLLGHMVAAFWHQFVLKDGTLRRML